MLQDIIEELRGSGAAAWSVTDVQKNGWEFYFIRHRLDQNRTVNTEHITVTVYEHFDGSVKQQAGENADTDRGNAETAGEPENSSGFLGSASDEIAPTASREEIRTAIARLRARAALVQNPFYTLRRPAEQREDELAQAEGSGSASEAAGTAGMAEEKLSGMAEDFLETMTGLPETPTEDINSYEIFTSLISRRLITSAGIDQTQTYPSSMLEVVTNAREKAATPAPTNSGKTLLEQLRAGGSPEEPPHIDREIELYRLYNSGTCDKAALCRDITRTLHYGKDRLHTVPTPPVQKIPLVLSTADAVQVCRYFVDRMDARLVYQKLSDWTIGRPVAEDVRGDRVTVETRKTLPNSSCNFLWDAEGAPIRDETLIRDGMAQNYWGNAMFSSYLGLKDTFQVSNYAVSGGTRSEAEIRTGRYLEVVEFSDFQTDAMTGDIFGEIRLGYLHDGDQVTVVSGGSVSGSMRDYAKEMYLSREQVQYDNALVPAVIKLMNVTVTGAA